MNEPPTVRRLTDPELWDRYWDDFALDLPAEVKKSDSLLTEALTDAFDQYVPPGHDLSALEIGGSSGRYLVYLYRTLGYRAYVLESSPVGCEAARRNLEMLDVPGGVYLGDMFDESLKLPPMDLVYSLGLIEHFDDPAAVAGAHLRFLKPGGTLVIGVPNLEGINRILYRTLSPSIFEWHDVHSADPRSWTAFERRYGLETIFKGYIGGFEPSQFWRREGRNGLHWLLAMSMKSLAWVINSRRTRVLRRANHRAWSAYVIAVYRKPG